jgi:hypothetical protein
LFSQKTIIQCLHTKIFGRRFMKGSNVTPQGGTIGMDGATGAQRRMMQDLLEGIHRQPARAAGLKKSLRSSAAPAGHVSGAEAQNIGERARALNESTTETPGTGVETT